MTTAKEWKEKGNHLVQERKYQEALDCYTKAIELDKNDPILYSNRSAMYYNLNDFENALLDAEEAIYLKPDYAKAYLRKGNALEKQYKYQEALDTYKIGLQKDKNNIQLLEAYQKLEDSLKNLNGDKNDNEYEDQVNEDKGNKSKSLIEKYALKKNVRIYFDRQIGVNLSVNGVIEEIKDGFIYFHEENNKFHILNMKNIIDIIII